MKWQAIDPGLLQMGERDVNDAQRGAVFSARLVVVAHDHHVENLASCGDLDDRIAHTARADMSDPAPSGVTFTSVAQQPSQGSCSIQSGGALLTCSIGTLAVGQSVAIKVNATVTQTGTITNTGTTTTTTPDTNPANNTDSAQTIVVAPLKPPVKPPVVAPEICNTVTVTPKMLKGNGKSQKITVKVTQGKKGVAGAKVKITGPGISKTVTSGKNGKVTVTVKPSKPGIIRVEIQNKKACNTQRIGVVGVFEPPVTG